MATATATELVPASSQLSPARRRSAVRPVLAGIAALLAASGCAAEAQDPPRLPAEPANSSPKDLAAQNAEFACDLLRQLHGRMPQNIFFSPMSISTAVGMAWAGAGGPTADQIAATMRWSQGQDPTHDSFAALANRLAPPRDPESNAELYEWSSANRVWPGISVLPAFSKRLETSYASDVSALDFGHPDAAARAVNGWASRWTRGHIPNIVGADDMRGLVLLLTNAVYFKGTWATPFEESATSDEPFHLAGGTTTTVPMMHSAREAMYSAGEGFASVALPYRGGVSCVFILPDEGRMNGVVSAISGQGLSDARRAMRQTAVILSIPRLSAASRFSVAEDLKGLGMQLAFSDKADFSGISGEMTLKISDVIHAATIDMDEKGTVATAVTSIGIAPTAIRPRQDPIVFKVDRPYLVAIVHDTTGAVLFLGRINDAGAR